VEMHKSAYRMFKFSWGIVTDITREIIEFSKCADKSSCIWISHGLCVKVLSVISVQEMILLCKGLKNISEIIENASPYGKDTLIIFHKFDPVICDYQDEGIVPAIYQWISEILNVETPEIESRFNRELNRYEFDFDFEI